MKDIVRSQTQATSEVREADAAGLPGGPAAILRYWTAQCGGAFAPTWKNFDLMMLPVDLIPWSLVVDVIGDGEDFVYRYFGSDRARLHGRNYTGLSIRDMDPPYIYEKISTEYRRVVEQRQPVHVLTKGTDTDGRAFAYEFLRLPLSDDGETVTKIYAVGFNGDEPEAIFDHWSDTIW